MQELADLIDQLSSKQSEKRRSAARRLRKIGDVTAGPALFAALQREIKDTRTWETQYQMIMAIGHCRYTEAFPIIQILAHEKFWATMRLVAIGDTFVRLRITSERDAQPIRDVFKVDNSDMLYNGALRAAAMLRLCPSETEAAEIINFIKPRAEASTKQEGLKFWLVAGCAGWSGPVVNAFIEECLASPREDVREAAADAKAKKYRNWRPL